MDTSIGYTKKSTTRLRRRTLALAGERVSPGSVNSGITRI